MTGRTLPGGYVLGELLGRGGMGRVYEGTHVGSGRPVAIKVLSPKLARHPTHLERFRREAEMTSSLGHPNLVSVEFFDHESSDLAFYVMERLRGEPLSRVTSREGRVAPERAVDIVAQVLAGLDAAHRAGVIHRDLKPSNIFVTPGPDGRELVKVVDFGLAKLLTSDATKLTVTGSVVGTPHYLSPEQALGHATDPRSDLFACGVVLYELLTGVRPFDGKDVAELLKKIAHADARRVETVAPEVSTELGDAVHRALARNPAHRFPSAAAMRSVILDAVGKRGARVARKKRRSGLPLLGLLAIAGFLGAMVAVSVVVGLSLFAGGDEADAASSFEEPAAVTPILDEGPTGGAPPMAPTPGTATATTAAPTAAILPPSLGIPDCDAAGQLACRCRPVSLRPQMCSSAHEAFRQWRSVLNGGEQNRAAIEQACREWSAQVRRVCTL
jgi:tRNA A-37 threonylcarbamoyl transferase component Bud32